MFEITCLLESHPTVLIAGAFTGLGAANQALAARGTRKAARMEPTRIQNNLTLVIFLIILEPVG